MLSSISWVITLLWLMYEEVYCQSTNQCHDAYECALTTISDTTTSGSNVECYGYHSCTQAIKIESTANAYIYCYGGYSCAEAALIQHTGTTFSRHIYCYGLYSCAFVNSIYNQYGSVFCYGELSCAESLVVVENYPIYCYATRACYKSDLKSSHSFYLYGHLAAQDAIIRSGDSSVSLILYGSDAANGAELICNQTCYLYCFGGGCNNITLSCEGGGSSCTINTYCNDAEYSEVCPDGYIIPDYLSIPNLRDKEFSTYDNSYKSCYTPSTGALNCDDYEECQNSGTLDENTPICCTSYEACRLTTNINANVNVNDSNVYKTAIRADGYYSADDISGTIFAENGGNIYFSGAYANYDTSSTYKTTIKALNNADIISSGIYATFYKIITQARDLYCGGAYSCRFAQISSIDGMVFAGGYLSLQYSLISNVNGNVYCASRYGCYRTTMTNIGGNVVGLGDTCLYFSTFYNVSGTVAGYGSRSLYGSSMDNVVNVIAEGEQSLYSSSIHGISTLTVNGNNSMSRTTVISDVVDGNIFIANINGTNDEIYDIYCNSTDTCEIYCESPNACSTLRLHCFGTCCVECDESNGISCPFFGVYEICDSTSETTTTTTAIEIPTGAPTRRPSDSPTTLSVSDPPTTFLVGINSTSSSTGVELEGSATVVIDGGSKIDIDCFNMVGCEFITLVCIGECNILCDESIGVYCPKVIGW